MPSPARTKVARTPVCFEHRRERLISAPVQPWAFVGPQGDRYTIRITVRYEWNEEKSRRNRKKHGVT
jgi:hypothetical protein